MSDPLSDAALALYAEAPAGMRPLAGDVESMARELLSLRAEVARLRAEREAAVAEAERAYDASLIDAARAEDRALERDAALAEAGRLRRDLAAVPELAIAYSCASEDRDAARARVERLRRVALAAYPRTISIIADQCHGLGCGACLACGFMGLQPGDLADETHEAPGRREGEPGAEEG